MRFICKRIQEKKPQKSFIKYFECNEESMEVLSPCVTDSDIAEEKPKKNHKRKKNKIEENKSTMDKSEKIAMAQEILGTTKTSDSFKILKKDKGLIERTESSKTILTEDNKELLND